MYLDGGREVFLKKKAPVVFKRHKNKNKTIEIDVKKLSVMKINGFIKELDKESRFNLG